MTKKIFSNLNQLSLPFGTTRTRALRFHVDYDNRVKIFWAFVACSLLSLIAYVYAVNLTARNVAQRAALEAKSTELTTALASLEFKYIGLENAITPDVLAQYGFTQVNNPLYVARGGNSSLSFNTEKP